MEMLKERFDGRLILRHQLGAQVMLSDPLWTAFYEVKG